VVWEAVSGRLSRQERPKQFLDILGTGETLLQQTFRRFLDVCKKENIYVVTSSEHKDLVAEQLEIKKANILAEALQAEHGPLPGLRNLPYLKENPDAVITVTLPIT
jgi:mannose-1-phosphate guanylyltransferase